jgi:hypothetical protein
MEIFNEGKMSPKKKLYKCIRKSKEYKFLISDFWKKAFEGGSKDERGRRTNKKASISDRDALEVKRKRVIGHVSLFEFCKTSFCR